jgi:hypothetical protein
MRPNTTVPSDTRGHRTPMLPLSGRKGLSGTAAVVFALLFSACAAPSLGGGSAGSHVCADKVAQAAVAGSVPGLWKCLDDTLQTTMHAYGQDGDGALIKTPFAAAVKFLGCTADVCVYELTLLPDVAAQVGSKTAVLAVWHDPDGRISNVGIPAPVY